eukprot:4352487-Pyramimonas_sp.AAC.1
MHPAISVTCDAAGPTLKCDGSPSGCSPFSRTSDPRIHGIKHETPACSQYIIWLFATAAARFESAFQATCSPLVAGIPQDCAPPGPRATM